MAATIAGGGRLRAMDFSLSGKWLEASLLLASLLAATSAMAKPVTLPEKVSAPWVHPAPAGNIPPARLGDTPIPEPRPDDAAPSTPKTEQPADPRSAAPRPAAMPAGEKSCRKRLRQLDVDFDERPPLSDPAGCALPWPLEVKSLGEGIELTPPAIMNCAIAETATHFVRDVISPAAKAVYGEGLATVAQASAYVCRPRNGSQKLSEHAFGNALDTAGFTLSKGAEVDVSTTTDAKAARFLDRIRKAACGPFKTVLGPGSDDDHALHFHFDLAPRKNGGLFCQ